MIKAIADKKKASQKYEEISKKIREALPSVDAAAYFERVKFLTERIAAYEDSLETLDKQIAELGTTITNQKALVDRLRKALLAKAKDRTAHEFTSRISQVMQRMISDVTKEKFHQIESLTLEMFNKIMLPKSTKALRFLRIIVCCSNLQTAKPIRLSPAAH